MRAGRLNRRIILQSPGANRDGSGQDNVTWTTVATVWGAVEPVRGRESADAQKIVSEVDVKIIIRHRTDVLPSWRARLSDSATSPATTRTFRIIDVIKPRDGRSVIELMCEEYPLGEGD